MQHRDFYARARMRALIETLALAAAVLAGVLAFPLIANATPAVGATAPDFVLKDLDGRNLRLSEYRGDVVVLAFWASWCGPCRENLAGLNSLPVAGGDSAPVVLGVNLGGDAAQAGSFARSLGLRFPTLIDSKQTVGRLYDVEQLPLTLLVDRDGLVLAAWSKAPAATAELMQRIRESGQ
jgi:peroxiredoxin